MGDELSLWEVFVRADRGIDHKHIGSLHASDAEHALETARDVYTRRQEGVSIWVVRSQDIFASQEEDSEMLFEPSRDKVYRHSTFYEVSDKLKL